VERTFAHVSDTGGARRSWLRGLIDISKRYLIQVAARNLGLLMRKLFGVGTPRSPRGPLEAHSSLFFALGACWLAIMEEDADRYDFEVQKSFGNPRTHELSLEG
jgi:hypothetical protein